MEGNVYVCGPMLAKVGVEVSDSTARGIVLSWPHPSPATILRRAGSAPCRQHSKADLKGKGRVGVRHSLKCDPGQASLAPSLL